MKSLSLAFVGDISLNDDYDYLLACRGGNFPFEKIKSEFDDIDIVAGNLESPFSSNNLYPAFEMKTPLRAEPVYAKALKCAGFNVLNMSNNHILDYGEEAAKDTQILLDEHDIKYFGYGANLKQAKKMRVVSIDSTRVGFVGYTDVVIDSPFFAGPDSRGVVKFDIDDAIVDTINNKKMVDLLVINLHWGIEYFHLPTPVQIDNARKLIDAGADIIIGHHPHVLQGIEKYKNGIIAYSLGNFLFSEILWEWHTPEGETRITKYPLNRQNRKSIILKINVKRNDELDYSVVGTLLKKNGQIDFGPNISKSVSSLSEKLRLNNYEAYFQRELNNFNRNQFIRNQLKRLLRLYKLRPKHIKELHQFLFHSK